MKIYLSKYQCTISKSWAGSVNTGWLVTKVQSDKFLKYPITSMGELISISNYINIVLGLNLYCQVAGLPLLYEYRKTKEEEVG